MLAKIAGMIEMAGLQIGARYGNFWKGGLVENLVGNIVDRMIGDLVNEADILVFAGGDARDDFPPRDFRIDDGFAPASSVVDHDNKILQMAMPLAVSGAEADGHPFYF